MNEMPRFTFWSLISLVLVLGCAAGTRIAYLENCTDRGNREPALLVQGMGPRSPLPAGTPFRGRVSPTQLDHLIVNLSEHQWFGCQAPLAKEEERTGHIAPGYPMLYGVIAYWTEAPDMIMRWLQCALGSLTAGCYFFFARRAFHSTPVATSAGLLCAFHPFWIINTPELNDGVLCSFLFSVSLALGARGGQTGDAFTGLGFGLALAGVALTRAILLPFTIVALLWFLWQCKRFPLGWFAGFLVLVGFVNGLATWSIRNYFVFERPVPIATSTYLHLWIGNHPHATGSTLDEAALRATLSEDRLKILLDEPDQAKRYIQLEVEVWQELQDHPTETLSCRINSALVFLLGGDWLKERRFGLIQKPADDIAEPPAWLHDHVETVLQATMLAIFLLAPLGWRWSYSWRRYSGLAAIAIVCVPLPYIVSHAEDLSGPRLPLDGVLLCFVAFALASLIPRLVQTPKSAAQQQPET